MAMTPQNDSYQNTGAQVPATGYTGYRKVKPYAATANPTASNYGQIQNSGGFNAPTTGESTFQSQQSNLIKTAGLVTPTQTQFQVPDDIHATTPIEPGSAYGQFAPPASFTDNGQNISWGTPVKPVIRNMMGDVNGQYVEDLNDPNLLVKTIRGNNPTADFAMRAGRPGSMYTIDHIVPLALGGADTLANRELLTFEQNDRKTIAQSVPYTLYAYGKISLQQARIMAMQWKDRDLTDLPNPNKLGLVADVGGKRGIDIALERADAWTKPAPVRIKDVIAGIPQAAKDLGKGFLPDPLREFMKGLVSAGTVGFVPYQAGENEGVGSKIAAGAGMVIGTLAPWALASRLLEGGMLAFNGGRALLGMKNAATAAMAAEGLGLSEEALAAAEAAKSASAPWIKNPSILQRFGMPITEAGRSAMYEKGLADAATQATKIALPKTLNSAPKYVAQFLSDPVARGQIIKFGVTSGVYGQAQQFVANHFNPYTLTGLADQKTQENMMGNIIRDVSVGAITGKASPTLKGTAYTVLVPTTLALWSNPDDPVGALTQGAMFGAMHATGSFTRPGYNDVISFGGKPYENPVTAAYNHVMDHAAMTSLRYYNPGIPETKVGEPVPKLTPAQIQKYVNNAIATVFKQFTYEKTISPEEMKIIQREFKGYSKGINKTIDDYPTLKKSSIFDKIPTEARRKNAADIKAQTEEIRKSFGPDYQTRNEVPKGLGIDKVTIPENGMDLQTALTEIKRLTIAGRQLYKGGLSEALRQKADLDDLLSYGKMLKNKNNANINNRLGSMIRFVNADGHTAATNPPEVARVVDTLIASDPQFMTQSTKGPNPDAPDSGAFATGDVWVPGFAVDAKGKADAEYFFGQKQAGHVSPNVIIASRKDLAPLFAMKNETYTYKEIEQGAYAKDPHPENALQVYGVIEPNPGAKNADGKRQIQLMAIGMVSSDFHLNVSTNPAHRAINQQPEVQKYITTQKAGGDTTGMFAPLTPENHKDTIAAEMKKNGLNFLIGQLSPKATLETVKAKKPFAPVVLTDASWQRSIELQKHLDGQPQTQVTQTAQDLANIKNSDMGATPALEATQRMQNNPSRTERSSHFLPQPQLFGEGVEDRVAPPREATRGVVSKFEDSIDVAGPAELKKAFQDNFGAILTDAQAVDIFNKRHDMTMRQSIQQMADLADQGNTAALTGLLVEMTKSYVQSGALNFVGHGRGVLDLPLLGNPSTRTGAEEHTLQTNNSERITQEPSTQPTDITQAPVTQEPSTQLTNPERADWTRYDLLGRGEEGVNSAARSYTNDPELLKEFTRAKLTSLAKTSSANGTDPQGWDKFKAAIETKLNTQISDPRELRMLKRAFDRASLSERRLELKTDASGKHSLAPGSLENAGEADTRVREYNKANGLPDDAMRIISIGKDRVYSDTDKFEPLKRFIANNVELSDHGGDQYVPMGITAKGEGNVVYVKYAPELVEKFKADPEKYLNKDEKLTTNEDKFTRVFNVDVLGLPKSMTDVDMVKRANLLYHRYDPFPASEGDQQVIIHNLPSKKIGADTSTEHIKPGDFVDPKHPYVKNAMESFLKGASIDGKMIIGENLYDKLVSAFNYDPKKFQTGFKPLISGDVNVNGEVMKMIQKGHAIKADPALLDMLKQEYGLDLSPDAIASFDSNVKVGPKQGTYRINLSDIYSKSLSAGLREGNLKPSLEGKLSVNDPGVKEDIMNQTNERRADFENFNKDINASKSSEELRAVIQKFADKYNFDADKLFHGNLGESFDLGAAKIGLSHTIDGISKNMFIETVLSDTMPNSGRAFLSPSFKMPLDGPDSPPRYPRNDEIVLGSKFMEKRNLQEGDEVMVLRDPSYDINNMVIARVVNGDKFGHTSLGSEHAVLSHFNERMKLQGDEDGDTMLVAKIGEGGVPKSFAEAIKTRGDKAFPFTEVNPSKTDYATQERIKTVIKNQLVGDDQTAKISKVNRMMKMLTENKITVKVYPSGGNKTSKYEILANGKVVESGETSGTRVGMEAKPKWGQAERQLRSQALQEAVDSKKSADIVNRTGNDPLWMLKQVFTQDGKGLDKFQARSLNKALNSFSQAFEVERVGESSRNLNQVMTHMADTFKLLKNIKESGVELDPLQEKLLSLSTLETFKVTPEEKVAADETGSSAARQKFLAELATAGKDPALMELRKYAIKAQKSYNEKVNGKPKPAAERTKIFRSLEDFYNKKKETYSPETIRNIALWAAVSKEANIAHGTRAVNGVETHYPTTKFIRRWTSLMNADPEVAKTYNSAAEMSGMIKDFRAKMDEGVKKIDGSGGPGIHDGAGGIGDFFGGIASGIGKAAQGVGDFFSGTVHYERPPEAPLPPDPVKYNVRGVDFTDDDIKAIKPILYNEMSSRPDDRLDLEGRIILNTAINRISNNPKTKAYGKTLTEVMQKPYQYSGYAPQGTYQPGGKQVKSQYQIYKEWEDNNSFPTEGDAARRIKAINMLMDSMKSGKFDDTAAGKMFYTNASDGTIWIGNTIKEAKDLAHAHEKKHKLHKTVFGTQAGAPVGAETGF